MIKSDRPSARRANPRSVTPLDAHIGARVRLARQLAGLTQEDLADQLGLTFQQIQKYERGANRVTASRLVEIAKSTGKPMAFFYGDFDESVAAEAAGSGAVRLEEFLNLNAKQAQAMMSSLDRMKPRVRASILALIEAADSNRR